MAVYVSTFISGLQQPVISALKKNVADAQIILSLDGLIVYKTGASKETIKKIRFFNNSFLLVQMFKKLKGAAPIENMIKTVLDTKVIETSLHSLDIKKGTSFRIIFSDKNELVSVNKKWREQLENKISKYKGLHTDRVNPDTEFWFLYRKEQIGFFMFRITKHGSTEKTLHKGELRPELAHLLCFMSEPAQSDIFLDPFCGYGSIPFERSRAFPYNMIFARDIDEEKIKYTKTKFAQTKKNKHNVFVQKVDLFQETKKFENEFIHKIVTDPPWGFYDDIGTGIADFYSEMMEEFYRILAAGGIMVILTARKEEFETCVDRFRNKLNLISKFDILVSGKKAAVYKLAKSGASQG